MGILDGIIRELINHLAYDQGAVDSGVHDVIRRDELAKLLDSFDDEDIRYTVSRVIREDYLSEEALKQGYGYEDAIEIGQWFREGEYRR